MSIPFISVVIPCYNESKNISKCLHSVISQDYPSEHFEILVVDGMSNDGTREILESFSSKYKNVRIIDNEKRFTPFAFNLGIKQSKGEFITILGAHSEYDSDYLKNNMKLFKEHPEISCSGGPIVSKGISAFGEAAALAMSNHIGVGNANHRFPDFEGYAEGACFPTFRKEVFSKIGLYDEIFVRNQDDELNYRLAKAGGKVYLSPKVKCVYYVRDSITKLFHQYFDYGFWRVFFIRKHKAPFSFRQLVPPIFFLIVFLLLISGLFLQDFRIISFILPIFYFSILFLYGFVLMIKKKFKVALYFPAAVFTLHFAYAMGFFKGILKRKK